MKAYRYFIDITGSIINSDYGKKYKTEEVAIPDLGLIINKKGIFIITLIDGRLTHSEYKKEIELPEKTIDQLKKLRKYKEAEQKLIDSFKFKEGVADD